MTASECKGTGKPVEHEKDSTVAMNANLENVRRGDFLTKKKSDLHKGRNTRSAMLGSHSGQKPYIAAALRAAVLEETSGFKSPPQRMIFNCRADIKDFASKGKRIHGDGSISEKQDSNPQINKAPRLIVLCGPTHSGKSTFAKELKDFVIVNSDRIRKEITGESMISDQEDLVWKAFSACKFVALKKKRDIVLDACHMSSKARWHALQGVNGNYRKICVVFNCPFKEIKKRCLKQNRISLETAREMWNSFQKSRPSGEELRKEGFDEFYFVKNSVRHHMEKKAFISKPGRN